jgi:hypothetical protein
MRFYVACCERLPLDVLEVRHEDLTSDFDSVTRRVSSFLGVPWDEAMRDVAATTRTQLITTPSAPQVARGVYSEGARWRRYKNELEPVMKLLEPWVARFGYPKD